MATTQYIGARYVPLFYQNPTDDSNNWLSGVAYDPLTVVTDLNQSYTSKIPVPASVGRPSENPTYWVLTGAYNAQIEQYRQEVEEYHEEVENIQYDIDTEIAKVNFYQNKKILILGDSLSDTNMAAYMPNWVTYFTDRVTAVGGTVVNNSNNGRSLTTVRTDNLADVLPTIASPETYTDIILFLGVNDWASDATLSLINTALSTFENWHNQYNPSARIHMITPLRCTSSFNPDYALSFVRCAMVQYGAKRYRWQIIDAFSEAPNFNGKNNTLSQLWTVDGLHIRSDYAPQFAEYIFERIASGTSSWVPIGGELFTQDSSVANVPLNYIFYDDGTIRVYFKFANGYTPASLVNMGTLPVFARPFRPVSGVFYYSSGGTGKTGLITIRDNGNVFVVTDGTAMNDADINITFESAAIFGATD